MSEFAKFWYIILIRGLVKNTLYKVQIIQGRHMEHLAELLAPELENTKKEEEKMVKELEQVEQEGKAYRLQLKRIKEQYSGRLGQITGFLGLNENKRRNI